MQQLIASYLFQNKTCPLPGLGTLSISAAPAESDFSIHQIAAPQPLIRFSDAETNAADLVSYIAAKSGNTGSSLTDFCNCLRDEISRNAWARLDGIGNFIVDNNGNIIFEQSALPAAYLQPVLAERVIHPMSEHHILVGDKETTNMVMTEYLSGDAPEVKDRWWAWAILLAAVTLLVLVIYFTGTNNASALGNATKI